MEIEPTANEYCLGNNEEQILIKKFLKTERNKIPHNLSDHTSLEILLNQAYIDSDFFEEKLKISLKLIHSVFNSFNLIPKDRYLVLIKKDGKGFYDESGGGFLYFNLLGHTTLYNESIGKRLVTAELLRNYIHDSIHFSTYRTFKYSKLKSSVYREQYGFNFRNEKGQSYSKKSLTKFVPRAINLNLLMDGITAIYVSLILNTVLNKDDFLLKCANYKEVFDDISQLHRSTFIPVDNLMNQFYNEVIIPSRSYIDFWGGIPFLYTCLNTMFSGDLTILKDYYALKTNNINYWENTFKQQTFKL